jgi:hypothetical protein
LNEAAPAEKPAIMPGAMQARTVLDIDNLQTHFFTAAGVVRAVDGVSYNVKSGETAAGKASRRFPSCGWSPTRPGVLSAAPFISMAAICSISAKRRWRRSAATIFR